MIEVGPFPFKRPGILSPMRRLTPAVLALVLALPVTVSAQNVGFLNDGPMAYMTSEDMKLLQQNYVDALEKLPDGATRTWHNAKTGHTGTASPLNSFDRDGKKCRLVEFANTAGGLSGQSKFTFCRQPDGEWKIEG